MQTPEVPNMPITLREMTPEDYDAAYALWQASEGIGLGADDSKKGITRFLARNPGLSFVALEGRRLVGAALCGHDGRRGYIHHLAVAESHRRRGVGRALAAQCLSALKRAGINKCHLFVFARNHPALAFWRTIDWEQRMDLIVMSALTTKARMSQRVAARP